MNKIEKFLALTIVCLSMVSSLAPQASCATPDKSTANAELHRLDFRVEGASCVVCLRRIGQELRDTKGVFKADVSIYKPNWAIVIYDAKKTNLEHFKSAVKAENVKFVDLEDKRISEMPFLVIPKGVGQSHNKSAAQPSTQSSSPPH